MDEQLEIQVPNKIKSYLDEIADRLWTGHSAVMIGSGFSKNVSNNFPDWNQLGNVFYEKIHGHPPNEIEHYLNVLKLANEVQSAFGRPALDQLIRIQIPDNDFEPSELHTELLELPWVDVFTTNYDTLLEKAAKNIISQKFDIVVDTKDLIYSEKPRIVKLHGSFPSKRPFIITEEDYRKYPKEFAPFVNTVQQSLIENTLCLIGFSGDDHNFLQWIGWIRDNLEKGFSPKIFLIGIFKLSEAQKKLIEERNIVLIDMSVCDGVGNDYKKALNIFFEYLSSKKEKFSCLDWPIKQTSRDLNSDYLSQIKRIIPEWRRQREEYPGWVVLPEDRRNSLWWNIQNWIDFQTTKNDLSYPFDIEFLYEFNWRLEKCLCPIFGDFIKFYELIIERYNPFPELFEMPSATVKKGSGLSDDGMPWDEIGNNWLELQISMMRFYREEGLIKQWNSLNGRLQLLQSCLSVEQNSRLCYERCLFALFSLDVEELRRQLQQWPVDEKLPFWSAKRAGLMAEQGDFYEAEKILEKALTTIRKKLNLAPISNDYTYVSQESCVMLLYNLVRDAIDLTQRRRGNRDKVHQEFHERWHFLKQFKCDPWNELKLFEACLVKEPTNPSEKHEFDIGRITTTHYFSKRNVEEISAYNFLRWYEEAGLLFEVLNMTLGKKAAEGALKRIANSSPYWSVALLLRIGDTKLVDSIFDREKIYKMDIQQIDDLITNYLTVINNVKPEIEKGDWFNKQNFGIRLAGVIPEILSRLCVKCSRESREKIFDFLRDIYKSEQILKYHNIAHLVERLMESLSEADRYAKISDLLKFPIFATKNPVIENDFPDPFRFLSVSKEATANFAKVEIDSQEIDKLLSVVAASDIVMRKKAIWRLVRLLDANLLKEEQAIKFANVLWGQLDGSTGFPAHVDFLKCSFLYLPHPPEINPEELFKKYINTLSFPIQGRNKGTGINITYGDILISEELLHGTKTFASERGVDWSQQEAIEIFSHLLDWWDSDKEYLRKEKTSSGINDITNEFKRRFENLVNIITMVIIPRLTIQIDNSLKCQISRLLAELKEYGMPCLSARAISIDIFPEMRNDIYKEINMAVLSIYKEIIKDAYEAIYQLLLLNKFRNAEAVPANILSYISTPIKWKDNFRLILSMSIVTRIIRDLPDLLPKEMVDDILVGLDGVINEAPLGIQEALLNFSDKLDQHYVAASLAYTLFKYIENKGELIPDVLTRWKAICLDINEFAEIRNQWQK